MNRHRFIEFQKGNESLTNGILSWLNEIHLVIRFNLSDRNQLNVEKNKWKTYISTDESRTQNTTVKWWENFNKLLMCLFSKKGKKFWRSFFSSNFISSFLKTQKKFSCFHFSDWGLRIVELWRRKNKYIHLRQENCQNDSFKVFLSHNRRKTN